ncbi:hypothetical protein ACEPPZ_11295 [Paracoccus yeei]
MIRFGPVLAVLGALWSGVPNTVEWVGLISDAHEALAPASVPSAVVLVAEAAQ